DANSDSPMWKRGNCSRSKRTTLCPALASHVAAADPAGPPPTTTTSQSNVWCVDGGMPTVPRVMVPKYATGPAWVESVADGPPMAVVCPKREYADLESAGSRRPCRTGHQTRRIRRVRIEGRDADLLFETRESSCGLAGALGAW